MLKGGIESTSRRGNFTSMEQARKHLADVRVVEFCAIGDFSGTEWT